jgi:hypothetical protein
MTWTRRIEVRGSQGDAYIVAIAEASGAWGCSCPRWRFSKKDVHTGLRADCKHIEAVRAGLPRSNPTRFEGLGLTMNKTQSAVPATGSRFTHLDFEMVVR